MIITISGYDGMGKSTSVELLRERICQEYCLKGASVLKLNDDSEIYDSEEQFNKLCSEVLKYDVVTTRFHLRGKKMQELQDAVMFTEIDVFDNTELIKATAQTAKMESLKWFNKAISKLLEKNKIVIYDRYCFDEVAYRSLYNLDKKYIEDMYAGYTYPDVRLYMYGDMDLIKNRNKDRIDMKTALFKSQKKMDELFDNMTYISERYQMQPINVCEKTREEVTEELFMIVKDYIDRNKVITKLKKGE